MPAAAHSCPRSDDIRFSSGGEAAACTVPAGTATFKSVQKHNGGARSGENQREARRGCGGCQRPRPAVPEALTSVSVRVVKLPPVPYLLGPQLSSRCRSTTERSEERRVGEKHGGGAGDASCRAQLSQKR